MTLADIKLPRNVKRGQLRKMKLQERCGLVSQQFWSKLSEEERDAVDALSLLIYLRAVHNEDHPAFVGTDRDHLFLTDECMRELLRALGARKKGWKAAREAKAWLKRKGLMVDTKQVLKPKRQPQMSIREEKAERRRAVIEGETRSVRPQEHFYWWPVYRIPTLTRITRSVFPQGAYGRVRPTPTALVSLSTFLRCQGLLKVKERRTNAEYGSVQCAFHNTGPP